MLTTVHERSFGNTPSGQKVQEFTLTNPTGIEVSFLTYGGIIRKLIVPAPDGSKADIVLGLNDLSEYLHGHPCPYFGAIIGRVGNRINRGKFTLDGTAYQLDPNNGEHHLHGGITGFDKRHWSAEILPHRTDGAVRLRYYSPDGEEHYPGNVSVAVTYSLDADNNFTIDYEATTDAGTPVNLTSHSYFNMAGEGTGTVLDQELTLYASRFTPVGPDLIPTGEMKDVGGTPFDFRRPKKIGKDIESVGGFDHNFVIDPQQDENPLRVACFARDPRSGRSMQVETTMPGVQFYSGNFLDDSLRGKSGVRYQQHAGFCLETQYFPDSPNNKNFPSVILRPGEVYRHRTVHRFNKVAGT